MAQLPWGVLSDEGEPVPGLRLAVAAVVDVCGLVLILQRRDMTNRPVWDLPHSGVATGETVENALVRMVYQQTDLVVSCITGNLGAEDVPALEGEAVRWHTFSVAVAGADPFNAVDPAGRFLHHAWISDADLSILRPEVCTRIIRHFCSARS